MRLTVVIILIELARYAYCNYDEGDRNTNSSSSWFVFGNTTTLCQMYSTSFCKVPLLIRDGVDLDDIRVKVDQDHPYYRPLKLEYCDADRLLALDSSDCDNRGFSFDLYSGNYSRAFVIVQAIVIGKGELTLSLAHEGHQNKTNQTHTIIVTGPDRFIDQFYKIYVAVFQVLMSIFMGLLIDLKIIFKIVKIPIPVVIGLICQYGAMPLVSTSVTRSI
jgi:hypothetical protein